MRRLIHLSLAVCVLSFASKAQATQPEALIKREAISFDKLVHQEKSMYRNILVTEGSGKRCMTFGVKNSIQSCIEVSGSKRMVLTYSRALLSALYLNPNPRKILIIGIGGGILPMAINTISPESKIETVELDPAVISVAERFFNYKQDSNNKAFSDDGRMYVRKKIRAKESYDVIILDAFGKDYIPEHLLTKEFFLQIKSLLTPNGILAANTFKHPVFSDYESATYQHVFGDLLSVETQTNRILMASKSKLPSRETILANALALDGDFAQFSVQSMDIMGSMKEVPQVTNPKIRILTDQFSPANLIISQ